MIMKKTIFMLLMSMALSASAQNAPQQDKQECKKGQQCEKKHMGPKCDQKPQCDPFGLSDKDAEKFKATFEKYMAEKKAVFDKHQFPKPENGQRLTDEQMDKKMKERFAVERELLAVKEKYYSEFRKFLTARQAAQLFQHKQGKGMHKGHNNRGFFKKGKMNKGMMPGCDKKEGQCDKKGPQCDKKDAQCDKK